MTTKDKIKQHLLKGKTLTIKQAYERYGTMRLPAIIYDLTYQYEINKKYNKKNEIVYSIDLASIL